MYNIINYIIDDNTIFYDYNIQIGFYNKNMKYFNYYINKIYFNKIKNKFKKYKLKKKNETIYKYKNKYKIINKDNNFINYIKEGLKKHYFFKNNKLSKNFLNIGFILVKENNYEKIDCIDFPNVDIEMLDKESYIYESIYKKSKIYIKFEIINNSNYSINIDMSFDKKIINDTIDNLNNIFKNIFDDINYIKL